MTRAKCDPQDLADSFAFLAFFVLDVAGFFGGAAGFGG